MKTIILLIVAFILGLNQLILGQATTAPGNTWGGGGNEYIGWDVISALPLSIKHELPQPIMLLTNTGMGGFGNLRMWIYDNPSPTTIPGFIGIGDMGSITLPVTPYSLLHSYKLGNSDVYHQFSNDNTGGGGAPTSAQQGFQIGIHYDSPANYDANGPAPPYTIAELRQWQDAPMDFYSNESSLPASLPLRMRISYGLGCDRIGSGVANTPGVTKVMIGHMGTTGSANPNEQFWPLNQGVAMLNLGENFIPGNSAPNNPYIGGARDWMDVGTYYNFDTDNLYTGLKDNGANRKDAIISWGDDPSGGSPLINHLFFNVTRAGIGSNQAVSNAGLEIARMLSLDGNYGRMGIGGDPNITATNFYHPQSALTIEPGNTLEVNSPDINETVTAGGNSGLRFSDLNTGSATTPNTGIGILAVNVDGDVIYVPGEGAGIGNYCGNTQNPITNNFEIPLHNFDYFFDGQGLGVTDVIIGTSCVNNYPFAKFQVNQAYDQSPTFNRSVAGFFENNTNDKLAVGIEGYSIRSQNTDIGVAGFAAQDHGIQNIGVLGSVNGFAMTLGGLTNVGTYGFAQFPPPTSLYVNYAVVGDLGIACGGLGCPTGNALGFGHFAGYFNGDVYTTAGSYLLSDSTLKENIQDLTDPMNIISQLNPKSYTFKQQGNESMQFAAGTHFGLLSQDVEAILPQLVKNGIHPARYDSLGNETYSAIEFKALNYTELIAFLIAGMKEQQLAIAAMQAELANLTGGGNRNFHPEGDVGEEKGNNSSIDVELKNAKSIILNVAVPNPFAEQTVITYFITDDVHKAQILFYDNTGNILKKVDVNEKGAGQINVYANDLSSGVYSYSLIADGKLIETKKMVKQN